MDKTIEELASEYYSNEVINGDTCDDKDGWTDCFVSGAEALMQLPLSERLNADEKERVKGNYADAKDIHSRCIGTMSKNHIADLHNEYNKGLNMGIMIALKYLFGSDFFKEGE